MTLLLLLSLQFIQPGYTVRHESNKVVQTFLDSASKHEIWSNIDGSTNQVLFFRKFHEKFYKHGKQTIYKNKEKIQVWYFKGKKVSSNTFYKLSAKQHLILSHPEN